MGLVPYAGQANGFFLSDRKGRVYKTDNLFSIIEDIELSRECEGIIFKESFFFRWKSMACSSKRENAGLAGWGNQ